MLYEDTDGLISQTLSTISPKREDLETSSTDEEDEEFQVEDFRDDEGFPVQNQELIYNKIKRLSRSDANSIVGGESIEETTGRLPEKIEEVEEVKPKENYGKEQKVFSFSLPFGGFSGLSSNLYKQFLSFKLDSHLPLLGNHDEEKENIRLRLERQQSIGTVEEANYFRNMKGTENVRLKAVKKSLTSNFNEMVPDFMHSKKERESWKSIYDDIEGNIVLLGGYRGSILRDAKTNKRVWIPIKAGFNLRKINLLLGPTKEDEINASKFIYPSGVLKNVGPVDICKKLLKKLSNNPKTNVKEFGYDWRLSGENLSRQFEDFLEKIYKATNKPVLVIAHSMGGLIAHGAMQRNPKLFRSIVYVGTPSECLNILGPIRFGDSVILSDKILTFETNFMMRSSFLFLPLEGRVFCNTEKHEYYDLDYFDPDTWVEYNLNPLVSKTRKLQEESWPSGKLFPQTDSSSSFPSINSLGSKLKNYTSKSINRKSKPSDLETSQNPVVREKVTSPTNSLLSPKPEETFKFTYSFSECYNYLKETLKLTKEYILSLDFREDLAAEYPPMAVVYGNRVPSVRGSNVESIQDIKDGNYYNFFYGHGDGVIHQRWLMPEKKGFRFYNENTGEGEIVAKIPSDCGHVSLMTDFKAVGQALVAVVEAEKVWDEKKKRQREKKVTHENHS